MRPTWPPARLLALAAILALLLVGAFYLIVTRQPWLGVELKPDVAAAGLVVVRVDPHSLNRKSLSPGDVIVGLTAVNQEERFDGKLLPVGEVDLPTFAIFNRYIAHHRALWEILASRDFVFVLKDGRRVQGRVAASRPVKDLPWRFWALPVAGFAAFLIGIGIAVFRPRLPAAPVIVVGGVGMLIAALLASLFVSRELTLPPLWFRLSMEEANPASEIIVFSLAVMLWYYPRPLYRFPAAALFALVVVMFWLNEWFQLHEFRPHTYMTQYLASLLAMIAFAIMQWRQTQADALSRAALKWFLLVNIVVNGLFNILSVVPIAYGQPSIIGKADTFFLGPLIYLGLAFGIARYRLFDIERWWLEVWLWLGGGLLVIGIDVLLITFFHLADLLALGFALILAGWVYLPLRQWLFRRVLRPSRTRLDDHFPLLIDTLFQDSSGKTFADRWRALVQRVFLPMELKTSLQPASHPALTESGLALQLPSFDGKETYELRFREQGRRLYTPRDVTLANSLLSLTRRAAELWQQREEGARTERGRIMRDLHDDVAARLLTLMHRATESTQYQQAHEALESLRQVIYALDEQKPLALADLLTDLQAQLRERARSHGIEVAWQEPPAVPEVSLGARAQINLQRILSEAASNAFRHCTPTHFMVSLWIEDRQLHLHFCNDGAKGESEDWVAGKGLSNIRSRIHELNGEVQWTLTETDAPIRTCCLEISLPLPGGIP